MLKWFTPTEYASGIQDIDVNSLKEKGIKVVMLDIDNTLVPTSEKMPTSSVVDWVESAKNAGLKVVLFSNNSEKRVSLFNKRLNLYTVHRALKPLSLRFLKTAREFNVDVSEICMIGDQVLTDVWGANNAGAMSILVMPLSADEGAGVRLKRHVEKRLIKKHKMDTYCLIGNPVAHSKSPVLHEQIYRYHNIRARYMLCHVEKESLGQTVIQFKRTGVKGFNVTVPFKQDIIPYLDEISDDARRIGAVNTVKIDNGRLLGYNTDAPGFIMQLKANNIVIKGSRVKIIGAGGATTAIAYAVEKEGAKSIVIYNRTPGKAQAIAQSLDNAVAAPLGEFDPSDCDILINTTSAGMSPDVDSCPVDNLDGISDKTDVYDVIYNPPVTRLMQMAKSKGCRAYNGFDMLIFQGIISDEIWFGRRLADNRLIQTIKNMIGG